MCYREGDYISRHLCVNGGICLGKPSVLLLTLLPSLLPHSHTCRPESMCSSGLACIRKTIFDYRCTKVSGTTPGATTQERAPSVIRPAPIEEPAKTPAAAITLPTTTPTPTPTTTLPTTTTTTPAAAAPTTVDMSIYEDGPGAGWTWRAVGVRDSKLILAKQGRSGSNAACAWARSPGGVSFFCPGCSAAGEAPFAKGKYLWFWIKSNSNAGVLSSTPVGSLPVLRVLLGNVSGLGLGG